MVVFLFCNRRACFRTILIRQQTKESGYLLKWCKQHPTPNAGHVLLVLLRLFNVSFCHETMSSFPIELEELLQDSSTQLVSLIHHDLSNMARSQTTVQALKDEVLSRRLEAVPQLQLLVRELEVLHLFLAERHPVYH